MAARCKNCGAELFEGQQFCRRCGMQTGVTGGEQPTRRFDSDAGPGVTTGEVSGAGATDSMRARPTAYYVPSVQPMQACAPLGPPRSKRGWMLAFLFIGVVGALTGALMLFAVSKRKAQFNERVVKKIQVVQPDMPPLPPVPPAGVEPGAEVLGDEGAEVGDDETTITRSFDLGEGARVDLKNVSGDIRVEGWDRPRAELRVVKSGGSPEQRRAVVVTNALRDNRLSLRTAAMPGGPVEVRYELKLPRSLRQLEISAFRSDIELENVTGELEVNLQQGDIELSDVSGRITTKIVNGATKVELAGGAPDASGASSFTSVNGDIELRIPSGANADVEARVVNGQINVDDDLGLKVEKKTVGHQATGRVGRGGQTITLKAVNGTIRVKS